MRTIVFWDWDDTFFPTSSIVKTSSKKLNDIDQLKIQESLNILLHHPKTINFIVTNSEQGWVEESIRKYIPSLFPLIQKKAIIISARTHFEKKVDQHKDVLKKKLLDHKFIIDFVEKHQNQNQNEEKKANGKNQNNETKSMAVPLDDQILWKYLTFLSILIKF